MLPKKFIFLILLTGTIFCADIERYTVNRIYFIGNEKVKERDLIALMHLKEPRLLSNSKFDQRILKLDAIILKNYYVSQGYLTVSVIDSFSINEEQSVDIYLNIYEGPQTILGAAQIEGNTVISDRKIMRILGLAPGKPYNPVGMNSSMSLVEEELARHSKLFTAIQVYETDSDTIELLLQFDEGPDVRIGSISINGIGNTDTSFITRELLFSSGDYFNQDEIDESEKRIIESGQYSFVKIIPTPTPDSQDEVDLSIELRKFKPREIISEGGFYPFLMNETANELPGIGGTIEWKNRNLLNTMKRFSLKTGANLPITEIWREIQYFKFSSSLTLSSQWFLGYRLPTTLSAYYETYADLWMSGYPRIQKYGAEFNYHHRFDDVSYITTGSQWERFVQPPEMNSSDIEKRTINFDVHWDATNDPLNPSNGSLVTVNVSSAGWLLGGNRDFLKIDLGLSTYNRLFWDVVLAGRIKYGFMYGWKDSYEDPLYDQFYLGGSTTLRGWENFRFLKEGGDPVGKPYRILTNWELRIPLFWLIGMEVFIDGGNLSDSFQSITVDNMHWDAGAGIVIQSPLGPVRVDYAVQLEDTRNSMILLGVLYAF